jgi:hypothetical protein
MKLHVTVTNDNGTTVSKGANESLLIELRFKNKLVKTLMFHLESGTGGHNWEILEGKRQKDENICPKYNAQILPDEKGDCSLCGVHHKGM